MTKKTEISKSSKVYFIKKNKFKIVYKIISVQKQSSRGALQGRCSLDIKQTLRRTTTQKRDLNKVAFSTLLKSHPRIYPPLPPLSLPLKNSQHIRRTPSTLLRKNSSGGLLQHVKRILKDLNYKKFNYR